MKNLKTDRVISDGVSFIMILLWSYTAGDKIYSFAQFESQLQKQFEWTAFVPAMAGSIILLELLAAFLLIRTSSREIGFFLSVLLMAIFTFYVLLVVMGYFKNMPCSCGGVISALSWREHLALNIFLLTVSLIGLIYTKKRKEAAVTS